MQDKQLTAHFALSELTHTDTGLDNTPNGEEEARLATLAVFMEKVRHILGDRPIHVDSAFRSEAVNAAVGGVPDSAHRLAYACDFTCAAFGSPYDICIALDAAQKAGHIEFDQLIQEGTWVHISRDQRLRGERLTKVDGGYEWGIHQ